MSMEYVARIMFEKHVGGMFAHIRNREGAYKRYLRLVRLLQEKGVPVKPVHYNLFEDNIRRGKFASTCVDFSGLSRRVAEIDAKKAFFSAMAAQMVAAPYASRVQGGYYVKKEHAEDFLAKKLRPEEIPRAVGEVSKRALKGEYAEKGEAPPKEIEKLPEIVEKAAKVLEEHFGGDPREAVRYILEAEWEDASMDELEKEYRDLTRRADSASKKYGHPEARER